MEENANFSFYGQTSSKKSDNNLSQSCGFEYQNSTNLQTSKISTKKLDLMEDFDVERYEISSIIQREAQGISIFNKSDSKDEDLFKQGI